MWLPLLLLCLLSYAPLWASDPEYLVYTGSFTDAQIPGIYAFRFNAATGKLSPLGLAVAAKNPTYFSFDAKGRFLYTVVNERESTGGVSAYSIDRQTGKLALLNTVSSRGANTCFVSITPSGKYALAASYASGNVAVFPVRADGRLGEASGFDQHSASSGDRQVMPRAHSFNASPDERFAIAADLGLDQFIVYHLKNGEITRNGPPFTAVKPGSGPRHFAFHPSGRYAYGVEETSSALTAFAYNAERGVLTELQTVSSLPPGFTGANTTADVQVHPSGKFVYESNRGADTIAVFAVDGNTGLLTPVENVASGGKTPRIFAIDPTGKFLIAANEASSTLVVFRIDQATGRLTPTGEKIDAPKPICVKFVPVPAH